MANPNDPESDKGYLGKGGFHVPESVKPEILQHGEHGRLFAVKLTESVQQGSTTWHPGQTCGFNFDFARALVNKGAAVWSTEMEHDTKAQLVKLLGHDPFPPPADKKGKS